MVNVCVPSLIENGRKQNEPGIHYTALKTYGISNEQTNRGYGTKPAKGLINFLFEKTNVEHLNTVALTNNVSSNKVIQKCGVEFICTIEIGNELHHHDSLSKSHCANHQ
jgi:RimJ/RimL family protein N-acetyltransferase